MAPTDHLLAHLPALHFACRMGAGSEAAAALGRLRAAATASIASGPAHATPSLTLERSLPGLAAAPVQAPSAPADGYMTTQHRLAAALQVADAAGVTPLLYAVEHRLGDLVSALLAAGAHPEQPRLQPSGNSALHVAALKGDLASARHLVSALAACNAHGEQQAQPQQQELQPQQHAPHPVTAAGDSTASGASSTDTPSAGTAPVPTSQHATGDGDTRGDGARGGGPSSSGAACVDLRSANGSTPLLYACGLGHLGVAATLVKAGADPSLGNADGVTPLMAAASGGHPHVLRLLLRALQGRSAPTPPCSTPPAPSANDDSARSLAPAVPSLPALLGAPDANGSTALHFAARRGCAACLSLLLEAVAQAAASPATPHAAAASIALAPPASAQAAAGEAAAASPAVTQCSDAGAAPAPVAGDGAAPDSASVDAAAVVAALLRRRNAGGRDVLAEARLSKDRETVQLVESKAAVPSRPGHDATAPAAGGAKRSGLRVDEVDGEGGRAESGDGAEGRIQVEEAVQASGEHVGAASERLESLPPSPDGGGATASAGALQRKGQEEQQQHGTGQPAADEPGAEGCETAAVSDPALGGALGACSAGSTTGGSSSSSQVQGRATGGCDEAAAMEPSAGLTAPAESVAAAGPSAAQGAEASSGSNVPARGKGGDSGIGARATGTPLSQAPGRDAWTTQQARRHAKAAAAEPPESARRQRSSNHPSPAPVHRNEQRQRHNQLHPHQTQSPEVRQRQGREAGPATGTGTNATPPSAGGWRAAVLGRPAAAAPPKPADPAACASASSSVDPHGAMPSNSRAGPHAAPGGADAVSASRAALLGSGAPGSATAAATSLTGTPAAAAMAGAVTAEAGSGDAGAAGPPVAAPATWEAEALGLMQSALPSLPDLELLPRHLAGLGLGELSAAQLEGLEQLHRAALARIAEARLTLAVGVEVARAEEARLREAEICAVRDSVTSASALGASRR